MIDRTEMAEMDIRDEPFRLDWVTALLPAERKAEAASWSNWFGRLWVSYGSTHGSNAWTSQSLQGHSSSIWVPSPGSVPSDFLSEETIQGFIDTGAALGKSSVDDGARTILAASDAPEVLGNSQRKSREQVLKQVFLPSCRKIASELGLGGIWRHQAVDGVVLAIAGLDGVRRLLLGETSVSPFSVISNRSTKPSSAKERDQLVWRQCVMIRQYLADSIALSLDLNRLNRRRFKIWWFSALEWTRLAEHASESFKDAGFVLPFRSRIHVQWQALFGQTTFR